MFRFEAGVAWTVVLLTAMSPSPTQAAEKIELRLRLQEGATYVLRHTLERKARNVPEQEGASSIFESEAEAVHVMTTEYGFHVEKLNADQTARARVTFRARKIKMADRTGSIDYDSSRPADPAASSVAPQAASVGEHFWVDQRPHQQTGAKRGIRAVPRRSPRRSCRDRRLLGANSRDQEQRRSSPRKPQLSTQTPHQRSRSSGDAIRNRDRPRRHGLAPATVPHELRSLLGSDAGRDPDRRETDGMSLSEPPFPRFEIAQHEDPLVEQGGSNVPETAR